MSESVVQIITSNDEQRRVEIFRRSDATYGFRELRWDAAEKSWILFGRYSESIVDSSDRALLEARSGSRGSTTCHGLSGRRVTQN